MQITTTHLPMLHSLAWQYHRKTGIDVNELYSEACLAAVKIDHKFDPEKGCLSTFVYTAIRHKLLKYITEQIHKNGRPIKNEIVSYNLPDKSILFTASIDEMQSKARELCNMIFNSPEKYMTMSLKDITKQLENMGWSITTIRNTFREIKQFLGT